jgi:hypothetical protein
MSSQSSSIAEKGAVWHEVLTAAGKELLEELRTDDGGVTCDRAQGVAVGEEAAGDPGPPWLIRRQKGLADF